MTKKKQKSERRKTAEQKSKTEKSTPKTQRELATLLGISPQLLNFHISKGDTPPIDDVAGWLEFLATSGREGSLPEDVRRKIGEERHRLIRGQANRIERENRLAARDIVSRAEVQADLTTALAVYFGSLDRIFLNELPSALQGLDGRGIQRRCGQAIDEVKTTIKLAFETWTGKDPENSPEFAKGQIALDSVAASECARRAQQAGVLPLWQRFWEFKGNVEAAERAESDKRRAEWCALRAAGGLPVPDASECELQQFPGLKRS